MNSEYIKNEALSLIKRFDTRDPFSIAKKLGITVLFDNGFKLLKGMYMVIRRNRFIVITTNISSRDQRLVCAHELGHDQFHRELAKCAALQEFMLYDMRSRPEYEANIFASELLIDDEKILPIMEIDNDICHISGELGEDMNLVLLKVDELHKQGYDFRVPYRPKADFLK